MVDCRTYNAHDLISYSTILIGIFLFLTTSISRVEQIAAQESEDSEFSDQGSETDDEGSDNGDNGGEGSDTSDEDQGIDVETPTVPGTSLVDDAAQPSRTTPPEDRGGENGGEGDVDDELQDDVETPTVPGTTSGDRGDDAAQPSRTTPPEDRGEQGSETDNEGDEETTTTTTTTTTITTPSSDGDVGRTFRSTTDGFQVQVPEGWVIHDVNNTGSMLIQESTQGYGILAQLCLQEEQLQVQAALPNVRGGSSSSIIYGNCEGLQEDIIQIMRYPDLDTRLQSAFGVSTNNNISTDNILSYYLQKRQEVGYSGIQIVNSTETTTVNIISPQTNQTVATAPAKLVEYTGYSYPADSQTRTTMYREYALLVLNEDTGYALLYKDSASSLRSGGPPSQVQQIFDSFELLRATTMAER